MKKRIISLLLAMVMLFGVLPVTALADSEPIDETVVEAVEDAKEDASAPDDSSEEEEESNINEEEKEEEEEEEDISNEEVNEFDLLAAELAVYASDEENVSDGTRLIFRRTASDGYEHVISVSTSGNRASLQDVAKNTVTDKDYTFTLKKTGTITIGGASYNTYHVFITVNGRTYYITQNLNLNESNPGTFLIKYANVHCRNPQSHYGSRHPDRLCLFLVKGDSYSGYWGQAVEYDDDHLTLCAQNDRKESKWDVCCYAYDLEEAEALIKDYTVTITKEYSGTDDNIAEDLVITLTSTEDATKTYEFTKDETTGKFTCNTTLPAGTYNISESGTDIQGYTWVRKDKDTITIPSSESEVSTQGLLGGIGDWIGDLIGGGHRPGGGDSGSGDSGEGGGSGSTTEPTVPETNTFEFTVTNTYTKNHIPTAASVEKTVVCADDIDLPFTPAQDIKRPSKDANGNVQPIVIEDGTQSVTLLYKITVKGDAGASFTVTDEKTTLVYPKDDSIGENNGVYTGTLPEVVAPATEATLDFYVKKTFQFTESSADSGKLTNEVKLDNGGEGKEDKEEVPYVHETEALVTITKVFDGLTDEQKTAVLSKLEIKLTAENGTEYPLSKSTTSPEYSGRVPAGTYTVSEENATVTHYDLTKTLTGNGSTTVDEENPFEIKVANGKSYSYTLTNSYTKQDATATEFDPAAYIVKTLTGDELPENKQFEVKVTRGEGASAETKTGTTGSAKEFTNAAFTFNGKFELASKETVFTVKETVPAAADIPEGLHYDTDTYYLKVECKVNASNAWVIDSVTYKTSTETDYKPLPNGKLVISNTYTKPEAPAEIKSWKETLTEEAYEAITAAGIKEALKNVARPKAADIENGKFTYFVPENTDSVTFAYCVMVKSNKAADVLVNDEASYIGFIAEGGKATVDTADGAHNNYTVKFTEADTVYLYFTKTFDVLKKSQTVVSNTATVNNVETESEDGYIRRSVSVNFSELIQKKLTITGDNTFTGATFYATLKYETPKPMSLLDRFDEATYKLEAEFVKGDKSGTITEFVDEDGNDLKIDFTSQGIYTFWLVEDEKVTSEHSDVDYDDSVYKIEVTVEQTIDTGALRVTSIQYTKDVRGELVPKDPTEDPITFKNTINTGKKGSHIKIDSPNKLNTDDHFAYIIGYPDGTVQPNGEITRAEVATIFFRLLKDDVRDKYFTKTNDFSDVDQDDWFNNPVSTMAELGIVKGYPDGTFRPNEPITRAEFAAIAARFDESTRYGETRFTDVSGHWAIREIAKAYNNGWIKGYPDNTFRPNRNITRAEAMTLINRVLNRAPETEDDLLSSMNKWSDNMDVDAWYYLAVQEATNSHDYRRKTSSYEHWLRMLEDPNWAKYER